MSTQIECNKCGGEMSPGFIVDQGYGTAHISTWQEGEPKRSVWLGLDMGLKQSKENQVEITTWRCSNCGYLEHYAFKE